MQVHYSSDRQDWGTPWEFFLKVFEIYNFRLDACASSENAKVYPFLTKEQDSINHSWGDGPVWCNPPYGKEQIKFIQKAADEQFERGVTSVLLVPARPDTSVWQDIIFKKASAVCFVRGRIKFEGAEFSAPFPCALVVFGEVRDLSGIGHVVLLGGRIE